MNTFKVDHLHIICKDLQNMIEFWTTGLGAVFKEYRVFGGADGAVLKVGDFQIYLRVPKENEQPDGDSGSCLGYDHLGFWVDDLDAASSRLKGLGCTVSAGPTELHDRKIIFLKGPDTITLELMQKL